VLNQKKPEYLQLMFSAVAAVDSSIVTQERESVNVKKSGEEGVSGWE